MLDTNCHLFTSFTQQATEYLLYASWMNTPRLFNKEYAVINQKMGATTIVSQQLQQIT